MGLKFDKSSLKNIKADSGSDLKSKNTKGNKDFSFSVKSIKDSKNLEPPKKNRIKGQFKDVSGIDLESYTDNLDSVNIFDPEIQERRAQAQSGWNLIGKALGQSIAEVGLGVLEGAGYLLDFEQYGKLATNSEEEFGNWFSDKMKEAKEYVNDEALPIYLTNEAKQGFAPGDATWWASNTKSIATTLSLMIPSIGAVAGLSRLAKFMGAGSKFMNSAKLGQLSKGITGAMVSRYMENTMEAFSVMEEALADGLSRQEAAEAASKTWYANSANLATDIIQYTTAFGKMGKMATAANTTRKSLKKGALDKVGNAVTEAFEEANQYIIGQEALKTTTDDNYEFLSDLNDYWKDPELQTSAFFGALGGAAFSLATDGVSKLKGAGYKRQKEALKNDLKAKRAAILKDSKAFKNHQDDAFLGVAMSHARAGKMNDFRDELNKLKEEESDDFDAEKLDQRLSELDQLEDDFNRYSDNTNLGKEGGAMMAVSKYLMDKSSKSIKEYEQELNSIASEAVNNEDIAQEQLDLFKERLIKERLNRFKNSKQYKELRDSDKKLIDKQIKEQDKKLEKVFKEAKEAKVPTSNPQFVGMDKFINTAAHIANSRLTYNKSKDTVTKGTTNKGTPLKNEIEETQDHLKNKNKEVVKELKDQYRKALRTNDKAEAAKIRKSNPDLEKDFDKIDSDISQEAAQEAAEQDDGEAFKNLAKKAKKDSTEESPETTSTKELFGEEAAEKPTSPNYMEKINTLNKLFKENPNSWGPLTEGMNLDEEPNEVDIDVIADGLVNDNAKGKQFRENISNIFNVSNLKDLLAIMESDSFKGTSTNTGYSNESFKEGTDNSVDKSEPTIRNGSSALSIITFDVQYEKKKDGSYRPKIKDGSLVESPSKKDYDSDFINEGRLKQGDTIHYEVDREFEKKTRGKNSNSLEDLQILVVHYIDGNTNNKAPNNRKVLGIVRNYEGKDTQKRDSSELLNLREGVFKELAATQEEGVFTYSKATSVSNVYNSKFNFVKERVYLNDIATEEDLEIAYVAQDTEGNKFLEGAVDIPHPNLENVPPGTVLTAFTSPRGVKIPYVLYTRRLKENDKNLQEVEQEFSIIADWANENSGKTITRESFPDEVMDAIDNINNIVPFNPVVLDKGNLAILKGVSEGKNDYVRVSVANTTDYLANRPMQVMPTKNPEISKKERVMVNLDPGNLFVGTGIELSPAEEPENTGEADFGESERTSDKEYKDNQNVSEEESKENLDDYDLGLGNTTFKAADLGDREYEKWNETEELEGIKKIFGDNININIHSNLIEINANGGLYAYGAFKNAALHLAKNAKKGTGYHEAFHGVFRMFLNPKERSSLIKQAEKEYSSPTKEDLENIARLYPNIEVKDMTSMYYEEKLADEFADYVALNGITDLKRSTRIKDFFKKLWLFFKNIFTNDNTIKEFFFKTSRGYYKNAEINQSYLNKYKDASVYSPTMSPSEVNKSIQTINRLLMNSIVPSIRNNNEKFQYFTDAEVVDSIGLPRLYSGFVKKILVDNRDSLPEDSNRKEILNNVITALGTVDNPGNFVKAAAQKLNKYGVILSNYKSQANIMQYNATEPGTDNMMDMEAEENSADYKENWQLKHGQMSLKETIPQKLRSYLESVPSLDNKGNLRTDRFGYVEWNSGSVMYNTLIHNLADSISPEHMMEKLKELSKANNTFKVILKDIESSAFRKSLGLPEYNIEGLKTHLWTNIASKSHMPFVMAKETKEGIQFFYSNRATVQEDITANWAYNYSNENMDTKDLGNLGDRFNKVFNDITIDYKSKAPEFTFIDPDSGKILLTTKGAELFKKVFDSTPFKFSTEEIKGLQLYKGKVMEFRNLKKLFSGTNPLGILVRKLSTNKNPFAEGTTETRSLKNLASLIANTNETLYQLAITNIDGEQQYTHVNSNYTTRKIQKLKSDDTSHIEGLLKSSFYKDSFLLKELRDSSEKRNLLEFAVADGLKLDEESGTTYSDMTPHQLMTFLMSGFYFGGKKNQAFYSLPILADAPNMGMVRYSKKGRREIINNLYEVAKQEYEYNHRVKNNSDLQGIKNSYRKDRTFYMLDFMEDYKGDIKDSKKTKEFIRDKMNDKFEQFVDEMVDNKFFYKSKDGSGLSNRLVKAPQGENIKPPKLRNFVEEFFYNDYLMQTQLSSLFTGPVSHYKIKNESILEDYFKRAKEIWSPTIKIDTSKEEVNRTYKTIIFDTEISDNSKFITSLGKALKANNYNDKNIEKIIAPYKEGSDITDAQAYITLDRHKEIQVGLERWSDKKEEAYQRLSKGEGLPADFRVIFNPNKPFHYGLENLNKQGEPIPFQAKNSEAILVPELAYKTKEGDVLFPSNTTNYENTYAHPELAHLLSRMDATGIYEGLEKAQSIQAESAIKVGQHNIKKVSDLKEATPIELLNENYGVQVETPQHHIDSINKIGTQIRKLIKSDLDMSETVSVDFLEEPVTLGELIDIYENTLVEDIKKSYEELTGEDGIFNKKEEEFTSEKLVNRLREEVISRDMDDSYLEALDYINEETKQTKLPLWHPIHFYKIQALMTSIYRKEVSDRSIDGGTFINMSTLGFSNELEVKINKKNGNIDYVEAMLPPWSKDLVDLYADTNGVIDPNNLPDEIKDMVLYRIPTEDKYSMFRVKVKGFTPDAMGGIVVLPDQITTIAGLDYDVDKVYGMAYAMEKVLDDSINLKSLIKELGARGYNIPLDNYEGYLKGIYNNNSPRNIEIRNEILKIKGKPLYKLEKIDSNGSTEKARNNKKIDIIKAILSSRSSLEPFANPGSFENIKKDRDEIIKAKGKSSEGYRSPTDLLTRIEVFERNMSGASLVGPFANHNAHHSYTQNEEYLGFISPFKLEGFENYTSLATREDLDGNRVSKTLASFLAAIVDNAKDPVAGDLNINFDTIDILAGMIRVGIPQKTALKFINNSVITDVINYSKVNGVSIQSAIEKIKPSERNTEALTTQDLDKGLADKTSSFSSNYKAKVISAFEDAYNKAKDINTLVSASRPDKGLGPTIAHGKEILNKQDNIIQKEAAELFSISGATRFLTNNSKSPSLTAFSRYGILKGISAVDEQLGEVNTSSLESFIEEVEKNTDKDVRNADEINVIYNDAFTYLVSDHPSFSNNKMKDVLSNMGNRIEKFRKEQPDSSLHTLLNHMNINIDKNFPYKKIEFFNNRGIDGAQKADIRLNWDEALNSSNTTESNLAKDLILYAFYTGGFGIGGKTFMNMAPISFFYNAELTEGIPITDHIKNNLSKTNSTVFANQFILNNYKFDRHIPTVKLEEDTKVEVKGKGYNSKMIIGARKDNPDFYIKEGDAYLPKPFLKIYPEGFNSPILYRNQGGRTYIPVKNISIPNYVKQYNFTGTNETVKFSYDRSKFLTDDTTSPQETTQSTDTQEDTIESTGGVKSVEDLKEFAETTEQSTTQEIKKGVPELFGSNPKLSNIGTQEQYSQYLDTIFPDSKVKDIVYHGSKNEFDTFSKEHIGKNVTGEVDSFSFSSSLLVAQAYRDSFSTGENTIELAQAYYSENADVLFKEKSEFDKNSKVLLSGIKELHPELTDKQAKELQERSQKEFESLFDKPTIYPVLLNIKNPTIKNAEGKRKKDLPENVKSAFKNKSGDARIIKNVVDWGKGDLYQVFEPEQIHILGSKQDIEGFKEFVKDNEQEIKPKVDTTASWSNLKNQPVYTEQGVNTMRTFNKKAEYKHFGNPFSASGYNGTIKMPSVESAIQAYKDWLLGNENIDIFINQFNKVQYVKKFDKSNTGAFFSDIDGTLQLPTNFKSLNKEIQIQYLKHELIHKKIFDKFGKKGFYNNKFSSRLFRIGKELYNKYVDNRTFDDDKLEVKPTSKRNKDILRDISKSIKNTEEFFTYSLTEESFANLLKDEGYYEEITKWFFDNVSNSLEVKPKQRQWILDQINSGKLDNATLQGENAEALSEVVEKLRGNVKNNNNFGVDENTFLTCNDK